MPLRDPALRRRLLPPLGLLSALAVLVVIGLSGPCEDAWPGPSGSLGTVATVTACVCSAVAAWRTRGRLRFAWSMLALYMLLYTGADAVAHGFVPGISGEHTVSVSDALYLTAFVPAAVGLLSYPLLHGVRGRLRPLVIDAAVLIASLVFMLYTFVLRRLAETDLDALGATTLMAYPLASALASCLLFLMLARSSGPRRPDVFMLGVTFTVFTWSDLGYVVLTVQGREYEGSWAEIGYSVAPLLLAAASVIATRVPTPTRELLLHLPGRVSPALTDLFALTALALATFLGPHDLPSAVLGSVTIVAVGVRLLVLTGASWRLRGALERRVEERTQEMEELTQHYERLDALKSEFITAASHELRTPLASIRGALEMLEDGDTGQLPPTAQRVVSIATRGSERLSRLVNDIIDLERLDSGRFSFAPSRQSVPALVEDAVTSLSPLAAQHGVRVVVGDVAGAVTCDPDRIVQVLVNLVGNALKFSESGTCVTVAAEERGDEVVVSVRDQGRGIPEDQLEEIFVRFHQIQEDDSREKGGAGLGLTICQLIVEGHGGRIWAESDGCGATFRFTLPTTARQSGLDRTEATPPATLTT